MVPIEFEEVVVPGEGYEDREAVEERNRDVVGSRNDFSPAEKLGFTASPTA